ncbi:MAG TPA: hypothetical protein DCS97_16105 [Planctomycetes bacterium]|nr:hypothetical protein [Planctomycetota bacterium]
MIFKSSVFTLLFSMAISASAADQPFSILDIAPDSGRIATDGITNIAGFTIRGQSRGGEVIALRIDNKVVGETASGAAGGWAYDLAAAPLAHGQHVLTASVGTGVGQRSSSYTILVDLRAPAAPTFTSITPDTGSSATDWITSSERVSVQGRGEAQSRLTVSIAGQPVGSTEVAADGTWGVDLPPLLPGSHTFSIQAEDLAGNLSPSASKTLVVDNAPPAPPVLSTFSTDTGSRNDDRITRDTTPTFSGSSEASASVVIAIDGEVAGTVRANAQGAWSFTAAVLADGAHQATAQATDAAGSTSARSAALTFQIKTRATAPTIGFSPDTGSVGDGQTGVAGLIFSGSAGDAERLSVSLDSRVIGTPVPTGGSWSLDRTANPLDIGVHAVVITATDVAGNQTAAALNVVYDPRIVVVAPAPPTDLNVADALDPALYLTDGRPLVVTGRVEPGTQVELTVDTQVYSPAMIHHTAVGTWTLQIQQGLTAGMHTISARAIAADNTPSQPVSIVVQVGPAVVTGALVTIHYRARVDSVNAPSGQTNDIEQGQLITGTITYRLGAQDDASVPGAGIYRYTEPGIGITATLGDRFFGSHPQTPQVMVGVGDEYPIGGPNSIADVFVVQSDSNIGRNNQSGVPLPISVISFSLMGGSQALVSNALPTSLPGLQAWEQGSLSISLDDDGTGQGWLNIDATLEQIWSDGQPSGDTSPPAAPSGITVVGEGQAVGDIVLPGTTLIISGQAELGSTVRLSLMGQQIGGVATDAATGQWSYRWNPGNRAGTLSVTARAVDDAGNVGPASAPVEVAIAIAVPTISVTADPIGSPIRPDSQIACSGTAAPQTQVEIELDGQSVAWTQTDLTGTWRQDRLPALVPLTVGQHQVRARAYGTYGGVGAWSDAVFFTVEAPEIVEPPPTPTGAVTVRFEATITNMTGVFGAGVAVGTPISGSFRYTTAAIDSSPDPQIGTYDMGTYAQRALTVQVGPELFGGAGNLRLDVHDGPGESFRVQWTPSVAMPGQPETMGLRFETPSGGILESDSLSSLPLISPMWRQRALTITNLAEGRSITAEITNLWFEPIDPAAAGG